MDGDPHPEHALGLRQRIHNRRGVHPQLHDEGKQHLQVAVLGGHRRNQNAKTQGQPGHHDDQQGEHQRIPVEVRGRIADDGIDDIDDDKESKLDTESQQIGQHICNGHRQSGKIHLAENVGVGHKGVGGLGEALGEIVPHTGTGQIEQRPRYAIGGDAGDAAEHDHVHDDRQGGLHHEPQWSKDGLLVLGDDITLNEQGDQIPVCPDLPQIHLEKLVPRLDDGGPLLF